MRTANRLLRSYGPSLSLRDHHPPTTCHLILVDAWIRTPRNTGTTRATRIGIGDRKSRSRRTTIIASVRSDVATVAQIATSALGHVIVCEQVGESARTDINKGFSPRRTMGNATTYAASIAAPVIPTAYAAALSQVHMAAHPQSENGTKTSAAVKPFGATRELYSW